MATSNLQVLKWIYCPKHADVGGNERANSLALKAHITGTMEIEKIYCRQYRIIEMGRTDILQEIEVNGNG